LKKLQLKQKNSGCNKLTSETLEKYELMQISGVLDKPQLESLLDQLPFEFSIVEDEKDPRDTLYTEERGPIEVYHFGPVVSIYPKDGKRLSNARVIDMDFPLRPDNMMDDTLGLRCCFHPRLTSFGINYVMNLGSRVPLDSSHELGKFLDEIEIDIHKFPIESRDRRYEKII
jgi:hypothetical protein